MNKKGVKIRSAATVLLVCLFCDFLASAYLVVVFFWSTVAEVRGPITRCKVVIMIDKDFSGGINLNITRAMSSKLVWGQLVVG